MKSLYKLFIAAAVIAVAMMMPVSASYNDQAAIGHINGDDNTMTNTNNNYQYDYDNDQVAGGVVIGKDNTQTNTNINVAGNVVNGATDVVNSQMIIFPEGNANYYGLDVAVETAPEIITLYNGQVFVVMNDNGKNIVQKTGDKYRYTVKSSLPVLTYVVNANEANRAEFDSDVAPVYDVHAHKFDLGNLDTIYVSKYRSPFQQFEVTVPTEGRYALVIDTRVSQLLNGKQSKITDDSVDITYYVEQIEKGVPVKVERTVIGNVDMFPILNNGMAKTS